MEATKKATIPFTLVDAFTIVGRDLVPTEHGLLCADYVQVTDSTVVHNCLSTVSLAGKNECSWQLVDCLGLLSAGCLVELVLLPVPKLGEMVFVVAVDQSALVVRTVWNFVELLEGSPLTEEEHDFFVGCVAKHLWAE